MPQSPSIRPFIGIRVHVVRLLELFLGPRTNLVGIRLPVRSLPLESL
ncbi:MAG TPA: hypothetical protein VIJ18_04865 [Microbacteriaceae bacterium]